MYHDFAFPNVFSHVKVTFGLWIWRPCNRAGNRIHPSDNERERMVWGNDITLDFLRAIASRPDLAKVITRLTVYACNWVDSEDAEEERACILFPPRRPVLMESVFF